MNDFIRVIREKLYCVVAASESTALYSPCIPEQCVNCTTHPAFQYSLVRKIGWARD